MSLLGRKGMAPAAIKVRGVHCNLKVPAMQLMQRLRGWLTGTGRGRAVGR